MTEMKISLRFNVEEARICKLEGKLIKAYAI